MFHFLVSYTGWPQSSSSMIESRVFERTAENLIQVFKPEGKFDFSNISLIPALFTSEIGGSGEQVARVGYINKAFSNGREVTLKYRFDPDISTITNDRLEEIAKELNIEPWELTRTHWSIKDIDLFRFLFFEQVNKKPTTKIFATTAIDRIQKNLVSVMMPFALEFNEVYETIKKMAASMDMICLRVDDIWENDIIVQDVVSLICRSRVVVCDCSQRNPNVFYEAGIAHALGKDVVLIVQTEQDIPFDLRHLRHIRYLNNEEGRTKLKQNLSKRINFILNQTCP